MGDGNFVSFLDLGGNVAALLLPNTPIWRNHLVGEVTHEGELHPWRKKLTAA
jgi:hypothetical protein